MNAGKAYAICMLVDSDQYSDVEKMQAIKTVFDRKTVTNSITKSQMIDIIVFMARMFEVLEEM